MTPFKYLSMKLKTQFASILIACVALLLSSCGGGEPAAEDTKEKKDLGLITDVEKRRRLIVTIDSLEQIVFADTAMNPNKETVRYLRARYDEFARRFPGDTEKSGEYLYKSAAVSRGLGSPMQAIKTYEHILRKHKGFMRAPEVAFLIAFTYDEDLNQKELAKQAYEKVIENYPGDHWSLEAQRRLETLDMSDEELLEFLIKKRAETDAQS